mgnify:CR=1 FL=1
MAIRFGSSKREELTTPKLQFTKEEAKMILSLIGEGEIKIKNIQPIYDLVYRITEFVQKD